MYDGGAEATVKQTIEKEMSPFKKFLAWLAKIGLIKGKNAISEYNENHFTKAVETCRKDGQTAELVHSGYELNKDEMMKIAAKSVRDKVSIYMKDAKHPNKQYTQAEINKMVKPHIRMLEIEEKLLNEPKLSQDEKNKLSAELEKLKKEHTVVGQLKSMEDLKIDKTARLNELKSKVENGSITDIEKNEYEGLQHVMADIDKKIAELKEYDSPCFQFGCNKSREGWKNQVIQEATNDRIKSPRDYNKDGLIDERDEYISKGEDVKLDAESIMKASEWKTYGISLKEFNENFCKQSVSCKQFASMSESLEKISYGAIKTETDNIDIYFPKEQYNEYKLICPNSSTVFTYANKIQKRINEGDSPDREWSFDNKQSMDDSKLLDRLREQDYIIEEHSDGSYKVCSYDDRLKTAAHQFEQKKTKEELDKEVYERINEQMEQNMETPYKELESIEIEDEVDISDGIENK